MSALPQTSQHFPTEVSYSADSTERMGRIVAVTGSKAVILLDAKDSVFDDRKAAAEIGTLLKIETAHSVALALISALSAPMPTTQSGESETRIIEVEFVGELMRQADGSFSNFHRGVSNYPSLGDTVYRATSRELTKAYATDAQNAVRVGHIRQDPAIPAIVKIDEMLGKHFAILGTTGTGKSCSVALLLRRILERSPQAHILLLDVHREYAPAFAGLSEVITPDNMTLPFWLLNFEEAVEILVGQQTNREADAEVLRELIPLAKARYFANQRRDKGSLRARDAIIEANIGIDTPIPFRTSDLVGVLDEFIGKLDLRGELAPYKRLKAKLEAVSRDPRYAFMFGSLTVHDTMADVLARLFRIPVAGKPVAILELGGLPSEIINVVVSVLARLAFDFGLWSQGRVPITFVCEEAHRYVPLDKTVGFEPTKRAISRIAKEGRKYGVSLCIVSQRPAELDPTILSQCNTIFSMRLTNERDQHLLRAGISDAAASLLDFVPTMAAGEAITFGDGVSLPTRIKFDLLPEHELPRSNTASFTRNWAKDLTDAGFLTEVVSRWRAQTFNPEGIVEQPPQAQQTPAPSAQTAETPSPRPSLRREGYTPSGSQLGGSTMRTAPPSPPAATGENQPSLASLIRQFRT